MSLLLRAAVDVDVDNRPHCGLPKFWQGLVYSLHKSGRGKFVGLPNEETEPSELRLPFGDGCFAAFVYIAVSECRNRRVHRRCSLTLASRMADGLMIGRNPAISDRAASRSLWQ